MSSILLIGPLTNKNTPSLSGGAVVLFENLLEQIIKQNIKYSVIDTNKKNYSNIIVAYLSIICQIFIKQFNTNHISLHSSRDYIVFAPFILLFCKIFNKKCSLRKFGGEAFEHFSNASGIKKIILNYIFKNIDYLFLEMKYLVSSFKPVNNNTFWFPNVRNENNIINKERKYSKKFIFISQVKYEKGIDEIINAFQVLDINYSIDIYGPIVDKRYSQNTFEDFKNINYRGALNADKVLPILNDYDVLILPTFYDGEGYPGIIIEGYSVGKPVISTNWKGIVEIVENNKTGLLIEPKNTEELISSIKYFTIDNYPEFSKNAKEKFKEFNSEYQTEVFFKIIGF